MLWRVVVGVLVGLALWWLLLLVLGTGIGFIWPEYREAARAMMQEQSFRLFTLPTLLVNYLLFAAAGAAAGWISAVIARTSKAGMVIAAVLLIYAVVQHFVLLWNELPAWYNLTIPIAISGFAWIGARIPATRREAAPPA